MIPHTLIRSDRKTVSIQITPAGDIILRCPKRMPKKEAEAFLESRRAWVEAHLAKRLFPCILSINEEFSHKFSKAARHRVYIHLVPSLTRMQCFQTFANHFTLIRITFL